MTDNNTLKVNQKQPLLFDDFMYFFMRIRKCRCRQVVSQLRRQYPNNTSENLAKRLVTAQTGLSIIGGVLSRLPAVLPNSRSSLRIAGIAGGAVTLSTMHLFLILKIALIFGKDIDDQARVPEMIAVIAATIPSILMLRSNKITTLATGGLLSAATAQLIGKSAIAYYKDKNNS